MDALTRTHIEIDDLKDVWAINPEISYYTIPQAGLAQETLGKTWSIEIRSTPH
jgi:hypothetical protein